MQLNKLLSRADYEKLNWECFPEKAREASILLFDDECRFCQVMVIFMHRYNQDQQIYYLPLGSPVAVEFFKDCSLELRELESLLIVDHEGLHAYGEAVLRAAKILKGPIRLLRVFRILPLPILNFLYRQFAKYRLYVFGKAKDSLKLRASIEEQILK